MPPLYTITPLSPATVYDGTLFEYANPAALFAHRIAFEQTPVGSNAPTVLSCRIEDVETNILPYLSSKGSIFKPYRICSSPTPGALPISRRDGVQLHIRHGGRFVIDYRTLDSTISSAHVIDGIHRTLDDTLAALNSNFSLVPVDYVTTVLSLCSSCSSDSQSALQDVSNVVHIAERLSDPAVETPTQSTENIALPNSLRKRPSSPIHASPSRRTRPRYSRKLDFESPLHSPKISPRSPSPSPSSSSSSPPKRAKTDLECAGVTDEIAEMMDEECESHEEFLLLMHAIYEKAGFPGDLLIGDKEYLEADAEGQDYYYGLEYEF